MKRDMSILSDCIELNYRALFIVNLRETYLVGHGRRSIVVLKVCEFGIWRIARGE